MTNGVFRRDQTPALNIENVEVLWIFSGGKGLRNFGPTTLHPQVRLVLSGSAMDHLAAKGFDPIFGARPVKRAIQRELETPLAQSLLRGDFEVGVEECLCPCGRCCVGLQLVVGHSRGCVRKKRRSCRWRRCFLPAALS